MKKDERIGRALPCPGNRGRGNKHFEYCLNVRLAIFHFLKKVRPQVKKRVARASEGEKEMFFLRKRAFRFGFEWFICFLHRVSCKKSAVFVGKLCFSPGNFGDFAFTRSMGRTRGAVAERWLFLLFPERGVGQGGRQGRFSIGDGPELLCHYEVLEGVGGVGRATR